MLTLAVAAEGGFNPLSPIPGLYVWTTISFLTVFFLLARKVFPKLQEGLADREAKIKGELEEAEATRKEAEKILADYKARVSQAREETTRMIEEARSQAENLRQELISRAEGDARLIVDKARRQLAGERERIVKELEGQLGEWSTAIAGRIIQKELTPQSHRDLVDGFIQDLKHGEAARA